MTSAFDTTRITNQFESTFFAPARAYAELSMNYTEKLLNAQLDAGRAYSETGLEQLRNLMNVKDVDGLREYMEGQQKATKDLIERLKGDAEKVVALQQEFVQQRQNLTQENVKQIQKFVEESVKQSQTSFEDNVHQFQKVVEDNFHQIQDAADSKAKPATETPAKKA